MAAVRQSPAIIQQLNHNHGSTNNQHYLYLATGPIPTPKPASNTLSTTFKQLTRAAPNPMNYLQHNPALRVQCMYHTIMYT